MPGAAYGQELGPQEMEAIIHGKGSGVSVA
jgi:hypothetical protein